MAWTAKDYLTAGLMTLGGFSVVKTTLSWLQPRVNEDDIDFIPDGDNSWVIIDTKHDTVLGHLLEIEEGFGVHLDYAPQELRFKIDCEAGLEKDLDAAKDVVIEYLAEYNLLDSAP